MELYHFLRSDSRLLHFQMNEHLFIYFGLGVKDILREFFFYYCLWIWEAYSSAWKFVASSPHSWASRKPFDTCGVEGYGFGEESQCPLTSEHKFQSISGLWRTAWCGCLRYIPSMWSYILLCFCCEYIFDRPLMGYMFQKVDQEFEIRWAMVPPG